MNGRKGLGLAAAAGLVLAAVVPASASAWSAGVKSVASLTALRQSGVERQHWDLTCGAGAIATLMTYQLNRPVSERQVTIAMLRQTNPSLVRARLGFSLLDLKRYAADQGLEATGYGGLDLNDVVALSPVIVPLRTHGFDHFVVLRGQRGDRVLLADPAYGDRTLSLDAFQAQWVNHLGFTVVDPADPHPINRLGAPTRLFPVANDQTLRAATALTEVRPRP